MDVRKPSEGSRETLTQWRLQAISGPEEVPSAPSEPLVPFEVPALSQLWPDEASREAEERLNRRGIELPWHYGDEFGDRFKIVGLRAGGIGAVFFLEDTQFEKRFYAAKTLQHFLHKDYLGLPTHQQKNIADAFLEEALPWLEMGQHANIVTVHLLENIIHPTTRRNVPFIFSEFMEKGDLRHLVIEKEKLLEETFSIGLQICEGLIHAYKHGLSAHKDLKPDNIMVYKDSIYKITDFSAGVIGTPGYMAPEQVAVSLKIEEKPIDYHADQFAIGLIMHDFFKGGDAKNEKLKRIAYIRPDPRGFIKEGLKGILSDEFPTCLKSILARCLQPESEDRFHDILELKNELLKIYRNEFEKEYKFPAVETDDSPKWWFDRGRAFCTLGRHVSAETPYEEAYKRFKGIPDTELEQARCLMNLGVVYWNTGQFKKAERYLKDTLKRFETIPGTEIDQARCLANLGGIYWNTGQFKKAERYLKDTLKRLNAIPGTEIDQERCLLNLGNVYRDTGQFSKAETHFNDALTKFETIPGTEILQAACRLELANVYLYTGQFERAEEHYKDALKRLNAIPGTEIDQAHCTENLGLVYSRTGQFSKAETQFKDALKVYEAISGTNIDQARCLLNLGNVYRDTGQFSKAETHFNDALKLYEAIPGTEIGQARCIENLGTVYSHTGQFERAEEHYKDALSRYEAISGTNIDQARCLTNLGTNTTQFPQAERCFQNALKLYEAIPGTEIGQARCLINMGSVYRKANQFERAEGHYKDALKRFEAISGTEIDQATCLVGLGNVYSCASQFERAEGHYKDALKRFEAIPGLEKKQAQCLRNLGRVYIRRLHFLKGIKCFKDAYKIFPRFHLGSL